MQLTIHCVNGDRSHSNVSRYVTDEHNNLAVFSESGAMVALYAAKEWQSATTEEAP